mmetsp:Transcript_14111/g.47622  ORF Transcript_14111/g.47622 Transcript_14111/m.47622 type:complete len:237 (-) Transcript_14111:779-1489(-)
MRRRGGKVEPEALVLPSAVGVALVMLWAWASVSPGPGAGVEGGVVELRQPPPRLMIQNDTFVLDGKPLVIKSAEVHYWRVHPSYWADRLERLAAMGVNAVQVYVSWNLHEEVRGEYDFSGPNDLVGFLQMAHDLGLLVLLRPGPYICAETDFGGLPYWLLNPTDGTPPEEVKLRTYDEWYMTAVRSYVGASRCLEERKGSRSSSSSGKSTCVSTLRRAPPAPPKRLRCTTSTGGVL